VPKQEVTDWLKKNIGPTLTSKRRAAYAEYRKTRKLATTTLVLT